MNADIGLVLSLAMFLIFVAGGMAVPFAILLPGMFYLFLLGGWTAFNALGLISWANMNSFTLVAIPLFILMAEVLTAGGLALRVYGGLSRLCARLPGGLLQTNIIGCAMFAAVSGSSVATAASIGSVALPELVRRKYDRPLSAGSLAAGGTLGILIPPSIAMIIYSTFTGTSVAKLFMAGVIPGLLLTALFMAYIAIAAKLRPGLVPKETYSTSWNQTLGAILHVLPIGALIFVTLGSMYLGWATPTEAAAVGCSFAIVLSVIFGELTWKIFLVAVQKAAVVSCNILFLVFAAFVYSHAISSGGVAEDMTKYLISLNLSYIEFFIVLFILFTVLGCLVESIGMIVITVPLLAPTLPLYGIDPVWFGIVLVVFVELGMISPPIGINLFVIQSLWKGKLGEVVMGTIPFHLLMFLLLAMLLVWPQIALWLPGKMY